MSTGIQNLNTFETKLSNMEITEDFPQKNCKYKPKVNGRKPKQMLEEHRKKRENRDSVGGRNHLKINGILGLNDERVLVPDDSKDLITKKFFDVIAENKNKIEVDEPCCALDPIGSQAGKSGYPEVSPTTNGPLEFSIPDTPPRSQESYVVKANGFDIESVDTIEESVYCPASSNKEDDSPIDSGVFSSYSPEAFQVLEINTDEGIDLSLSNDAFDISKENTRPKSIQENKAEIEVEESVALLSDVTKCPEQFSFEENNKNVDITEVAPSESTQQPEALLKDKAETSEDQLPGSEFYKNVRAKELEEDKNNKNVDFTEVAPSESTQQSEALPNDKAETSEDQLPGSKLQKELAMIIWPISKNKTQITSRKKLDEAKEIHKKGSDYIVPENHEVVPELSTSISQSLKENNKNENIKKPPLVESLCESFKQSEELSGFGAETSEKLQDYCELFEPAPTSQSPLKDLTEGSDDQPFLIHLSEELLESKRKAEAVGRQSKPKRRKGNHTSAKPVNKNNENENIKKPPPVECLFESINQSSVGAETSEKLRDYCVITEKNLLQGKSKAELEELFAPAPTSQSPLKDLTEGSDAQPFLIHLTEENEKSKKVLEPSVTSQISHSKEEKSHENNKNVDITEVALSESIQQPEALPKDKAETSEDQLPGSELYKNVRFKELEEYAENKNKIEVDEPCCALDTIGSQAGKSGYPEVSPTTNGPLEFSIPDTPPRSQESYVAKANGSDIESGFVRAKPNCKNKEELEPTVLLNGPTRENNKNVDITEVAPSESILPNDKAETSEDQLPGFGGQKRKANLAYEFIKKKQTHENTLQIKELELKEKQIELERKKLELEEQKERNKEEQFKKQIELQERRLAFEEEERRERLIRDKENEKKLCNMVQMTFEMMKQMTEMINKK